MNTFSVCGKKIVDEYGRERIFNGINFVYKGCKADDDGVVRYHTDITDSLLSSLKKKGINIIRLGVTWAGIEPEEGKYNLQYIDGVRKALLQCEKHEIYAFLDWHQDLFSYFCMTPGDGAPKWACTHTKKSTDPLVIWAEGYFFRTDIQRSFDDFWNNKPLHGKGLRDRYCDMLTFTANELKDCKALMGYDVFNEPYPGTLGGKVFFNLVKNGVETLLFNARVDRKSMLTNAMKKDVIALLSVADDKKVYNNILENAKKLIYKFDTEKYYPFLVAACTAIRKADPERVILSENCYYSNLGIPCSVPRVVYKNGKREENHIFSPHGYDITVDTPLTNTASPHRVDFIFDEHKRTQERLDVPVIVGEWGGMVPGSEEYPALEHLIEKFDKNKWSQTYWHYYTDFENGKIMDIISRPLPIAVSGTIKEYSYDRKEKLFTLTYSGNADIKAPTLIYLPCEPVEIQSTKKYSIKKDGTLSVYAGKGDCVVKVRL